MGMVRGGPSETGSTPASSRGVTVTGSASANTKGSWTEIIAATDYPSAWLLVAATFVNESSGNDKYLLFDVGIGGAASEQVLIANCHLADWDDASGVTQGGMWLFPVAIPAGTRIAARLQASAGSQSIRLAATAIAAPIDAPPSGARVETLGAVTASSKGTTIDPGATINTDGSWAQLIASTAHDYRWLCIDAGMFVSGARATWLLDIGIGGAGSEVELIRDLHCVGAFGVAPNVFCFPVAIPAGTRVAARSRCSDNTATQRELYVVGHGCG